MIRNSCYLLGVFLVLISCGCGLMMDAGTYKDRFVSVSDVIFVDGKFKGQINNDGPRTLDDVYIGIRVLSPSGAIVDTVGFRAYYEGIYIPPKSSAIFLSDNDHGHGFSTDKDWSGMKFEVFVSQITIKSRY